MKQKVWVNGNKMLIETGHKAFDKQTNVICTGNMSANTQFSWYIRAHNDDGEGLMDYPENKRQPGVLQAFDLENFRQFQLHPNLIKNIKQCLVHDKGILYVFFHYNGNQRIIHGVILTINNRTAYRWIANNSQKNWDIIEECEKYITE